MPEIRELTLKIKVDGSQLTVLSSQSKKVASDIDNIGKKSSAAGRQGVSTFSQMSKSLEGVRSQISGLIISTAKWGAILGTIGSSISIGAIVKQGIEFNKTIETSRIGLGAVVAATQNITDAQGRVLQGAEKFNVALGIAEGIQKKLQVANLETSATFDQLLLTAQAVIAAGSAQNINLDNSLKLTTALVQATTGIGLQMNQAVSESRSLLEGSINPMTDQLANALGINSKMVKEWQKQGTLVDELLSRLENFVRAGKLTQTSFAGISSNLKDAIGIISGQAFKGFFDSLKKIGLELQTSLVTFQDGLIKINPKLSEIGQAIDEELVRGFEAASETVKEFFKNISPGDVKQTLKDLREGIADIFSIIGAAFQEFGQLPDVAQNGIIGFLLFGKNGALLLPLIAQVAHELEVIKRAEDESPVEEIDRQISSLQESINAQRTLLDQWLKDWDKLSMTDKIGVKNIQASLKLWEQQLEDLKQKRLELLQSGEGEVAQAQQTGDAWSTIGSLVQDFANKLRDSEEPSKNIQSYFGVISDNAFSFLSSIGLSLGVLRDVERVMNNIAGTVGTSGGAPPGSVTPIKRPPIGGDSEAKKAARERERIEEQLKDAINKIVLDREGYERAEMQKTVDKAKKAGADKTLIAEFVKEKEEDINKNRFSEQTKQIQELIQTISLFGKTPNEIAQYENAVAKAQARTDNWGDKLDGLIDFISQLQLTVNRLEFRKNLEEQFKSLDIAAVQIKNAREEFAEFVNTILQVANDPQLSAKLGITIEQANEAIIFETKKTQKAIHDIERDAYIERLKLSDSFSDRLKGGFLEFVRSVEQDTETISNFFADTMSEMSQAFGDVFYDVVTGKFDSLVDVAKAAFKSILRAFLDLVSAIATRQIVVSIGGLFGLSGGKGGGAGGAGGKGAGGQASEIVGQAGGVIGGAGSGVFGGLFSAGTVVPDLAIGAIPGSTLTVGAGPLAALAPALPWIGAALAAAAIIIPLVIGLFKKTPRLDIDFDSVKTEVGRRAAEVAEFLDPEFFKEQIAQISVKRGGVGLGAGGDEGIKDIIQKKIAETVDAVQAIINKLPADLARQLNEALLNTPVDIETVVKGERLLEFDAKGKKIKEKFEAFINGELSAKFLFAIRDFFVGAFESLGVLPDKAQAFIDAEFEKFKNAGSREERAKIGQELLASFNAFVDAFNIVSGNVNDAIGQTIANVNALAQDLGFEAVPSIGELREELGKLLENAELDPETVQKYVELRNAIVQGIQDIAASISGLIGKIQSLNDTIVSFGGAGVDLGPVLDQASADLIDFFKANVGNLSLAEQEAFLDQIGAFAQAQLAEERAAFEAEQKAQQAAAEAAKAAVQARIDGLNQEKDKINEAFRARIDSLNEELRIAEDFAQLTESIRKTLDSILFSPESVLTGVEQVNVLQSRIANLQEDISKATDPEDKLKIAQQIQEAFSNLFDAAGEAFGINSPEFISIFDAVTGGLESLADLTSSQGRSVEEINAEIEKLTAENQEVLKGIDAKIEAAQAQLSAIGTQTANNTFKASEKLQETLKWLQDEYLRILEERLDQLHEATSGGFENELDGITDIAASAQEMKESLAGIHGEVESSTGLLTQIRDSVVGGGGGGTGGGSGVGGQDGNPFTKMAGGGTISEKIWGIGESGRRYMFGEAGREYVVPASRARNTSGPGKNEMQIKVDINVNGGSKATIDNLAYRVEDVISKSIRQGRLRKDVQDAANRAL